MKSLPTLILCILFGGFGSLAALRAGTSGEELRTKLAELDKLRADKVITDAEYQEMRRSALQSFGQGGASTARSPTPTSGSVAAAIGSASRSGGAPDLSSPTKTVEALQRAWDAKDQAGVVRVTAGKLKEKISGSSAEIAEQNFAKMKIGSIGEVKLAKGEDGSEQARVTVKMIDREGKQRDQDIRLMKQDGEWCVTGL